MEDKPVEDQLLADTTISGDLPIRPAQPTPLKDDLVTESPQDANVQDVQAKAENDDGEKPRLKRGAQTTRFEEDLSAAVGPIMAAEMQPKKKNKNRRPKIKRGQVSEYPAHLISIAHLLSLGSTHWLRGVDLRGTSDSSGI